MYRNSLLPGKCETPNLGSAPSCQRIDLRDDCLPGNEVCGNTALRHREETGAAAIDLLDRDYRTRLPGWFTNCSRCAKVCDV
jgi:hypothetical protein